MSFSETLASVLGFSPVIIHYALTTLVSITGYHLLWCDYGITNDWAGSAQ